MTSLRSSLFISQPCVSWISNINQGNLDLCGIYSVQGNSNWRHRVSMLAIIYNTLIITPVRPHHNTASCQSKHADLLSRAMWYIYNMKTTTTKWLYQLLFLYEQYYYYPFSSSVFHFQTSGDRSEADKLSESWWVDMVWTGGGGWGSWEGGLMHPALSLIQGLLGNEAAEYN